MDVCHAHVWSAGSLSGFYRPALGVAELQHARQNTDGEAAPQQRDPEGEGDARHEPVERDRALPDQRPARVGRCVPLAPGFPADPQRHQARLLVQLLGGGGEGVDRNIGGREGDG
eukprot:scaffold6474_cov139-Isochrysis_galbana.AAC.7